MRLQPSRVTGRVGAPGGETRYHAGLAPRADDEDPGIVRRDPRQIPAVERDHRGPESARFPQDGRRAFLERCGQHDVRRR